MPRTRPPYPPEFREEAVRLARSSEMDLSEVARELGVSAESLRKWVKHIEIDAGEREDLTTDEEREELHRLRRENKVLRQEKEILRRATAFSSGKTGSGELFQVHRRAEEGGISRLAFVQGAPRVSRSGYYAWKEGSIAIEESQGRRRRPYRADQADPPEKPPQTYGYARVHVQNCEPWASDAEGDEWRE